MKKRTMHIIRNLSAFCLLLGGLLPSGTPSFFFFGEPEYPEK